MNNALAPFSCKYTPQIPELLSRLNCSIAISTYQAGKLIFISPQDDSSLVQLPRTFSKPMGIALDENGEKLALATKDEILIFANSKNLATHYPKSPNKYDGLYLPRVTYHTGPLDIHDLSFGKDQRLFAVNTLFSSVVEIDDQYNFKPYWTPPFIDEMVSEDRCHLNGMALQNGLPKYITAFNQGNKAGSWRENITTTGVLMDVESNETILDGLGMPHSPRIFNDEIYVLLSAKGELIKVNKESGTYDVVTKVEGFVRGMDLYKDYLFIGLSKLRKNSSTFAKLDFVDQAQEAGILVIHLPTGSTVGKITYLTSLDEIYDIQLIPNKIRPNILNTLKPDYKGSLMTPEDTFWAKTN
ncbi:MAG: TIGR03032 family protein [Bacteroidetes bacterium]|nr:MAG: TIGR03032 family protein [Bacteroidota bacterium]